LLCNVNSIAPNWTGSRSRCSNRIARCNGEAVESLPGRTGLCSVFLTRTQAPVRAVGRRPAPRGRAHQDSIVSGRKLVLPALFGRSRSPAQNPLVPTCREVERIERLAAGVHTEQRCTRVLAAFAVPRPRWSTTVVQQHRRNTVVVHEHVGRPSEPRFFSIRVPEQHHFQSFGRARHYHKSGDGRQAKSDTVFPIVDATRFRKPVDRLLACSVQNMVEESGVGAVELNAARIDATRRPRLHHHRGLRLSGCAHGLRFITRRRCGAAGRAQRRCAP
jgi:hypothetical protein